ncbi:hypothetical protein PHJA_001594900 [Phtheirospermum japonicum]|uniref:Uncharacterized protein n=1 Tax=Phtheirospermum japonicum TaxID=374723 RepID=A0A830CH73_9LAMI|nr:hypothetical protein PHJA_001594900 [Phtheirospermum japonicum]
MAPTASRWIRPEVYPLFAAMGLAVGICGFNWFAISASILKSGNLEEGKKYSEHVLRKFVRNRRPEIMPSINSFFEDPQEN